MRQSVFALGAALAAALIAGAPQTASAQRAPDQAQSISKARSSLAGTISANEQNKLTFAPFDGGEALTIPLDQSVPIYQGGGTITSRGLQKGVTAKVHFSSARPQSNEKPVAIEVLTPQQAQVERERASATASRTPKAEEQAKGEEQERPEALQGKSQAGVVKEFTNEFILYDPYQRAAGDAKLSVSQNLPVYRGNAKADAKDVKPGADVRVFYEGGRATAIELLEKDEAKEIREAEKDVPRKNR